MSINGGLTFPIVLASGVPDNGAAVITVPDVNSTTCRLMVKPTGNIYYAVNSRAFAISSTLTTPTFAVVAPICTGTALSALPTTSNNAITGSWSPALNNIATTTYIFEPTAGQNATSTSLTITVNQLIVPAFAAVPTICVGATLSALPTTSTNGITGSWSPTIDNTATTLYTFTPNAGQCAAAKTMIIIVNPILTPIFTQRAAICSGATLTALPFYSTNGVSGTWSPALINTATTTYTFTPGGLAQCAVPITMTIVVNQRANPSFAAVAPICSGGNLSALPTTSTNGFTGAWSPAMNNNTTTNYTFTPGTTQCANTTTMSITVNGVTAAPSGASPQTYMAGDTIEHLFVSGTNIQWYADAAQTISVPSNTLLQDGTIYYATQTVSGCQGTTVAITAELQLSTNDFNSLSLTYSPNPVSAVLSIKSAELLKTVAVYNSLGQIVHKNSINNMNAELDLSNLASGSYFVKVESGERRNIFKIIKL